MKNILRSLLMSTALFLGHIASAQLDPPYLVTIEGTVGVGQAGSVVNISTVQGTLPALNINLISNVTNGNFLFRYPMETFWNGSFIVSGSCIGGSGQSVQLVYSPNWSAPNFTYLYADLDCGVPDCLGIVGGSAHVGATCDDGDPMTQDDSWTSGCVCAGWPDPGYPVTVSGTISGCNGWTQVRIIPNPQLDTTITVQPDCTFSYTFMAHSQGNVEVSTSCDWGSTTVALSRVYNDSTTQITANFDCGTSTDCLGVVGGPSIPGTPCDDGNDVSGDDVYQWGSCVCRGDHFDNVTISGPVINYLPGSTVHIESTSYPQLAVDVPIDGNGNYSGNVRSIGFDAAPFHCTWQCLGGTILTDTIDVVLGSNAGVSDTIFVSFPLVGCLSTDCEGTELGTAWPGTVCNDGDSISGYWNNECECVGLTTAISEWIGLDALELWPNPAKDVIILSLVGSHSGRLEISIIDLNGRLVKSTSKAIAIGNNRIILAVGELESGLYMVRISDGSNVTSRRFVKQ